MERKPEHECSEPELWYWIGWDLAKKNLPIEDATLHRCPWAFEYAKGYHEAKESHDAE